MTTTTDFIARYTEANELMTEASRDHLREALRLLGCALAYCDRYGEALPLEELIARIRSADQDPAADVLVSEGMAKVLEVLGFARRVD